MRAGEQLERLGFAECASNESGPECWSIELPAGWVVECGGPQCGEWGADLWPTLATWEQGESGAELFAERTERLACERLAPLLPVLREQPLANGWLVTLELEQIAPAGAPPRYCPWLKQYRNRAELEQGRQNAAYWYESGEQMLADLPALLEFVGGLPAAPAA
jgi:hypothetical protein